MTLTAPTTLGKNGRLYACKFDHAEAIARHAAGESVGALAAEYGVTRTAVRRAVTPGVSERMAASHKRWLTTYCDECRGPAMRLIGTKHGSGDDRTLCLDCSSKARRVNVRFDDGQLVAVKCVTCKEWLTPDVFPKGTRYKDLRPGGFHNACRPCQTTLRRAHREARKVPCARCGKPKLAPGNGQRGNDTGLCQACYRASLTKAAA